MLYTKFFRKPGGSSRAVEDVNGHPIDYEYEVQLYLCTDQLYEGDKVYLSRDINVTSQVQNPSYRNYSADWVRILGAISKDSSIQKEQEIPETFFVHHEPDPTDPAQFKQIKL